MKVIIAADASLVPPDYRLERSKARQPGEVHRPELKTEGQRPITQETAYAAETEDDVATGGESEAEEAQDRAEAGDREGSDGRRRRRRRRRGGRRPGGEESGDRKSTRLNSS